MIFKQALRIVTQILPGSELRHWFSKHNADHFAPRFVRPGFDVTIDAFPRSANTWIYYQAQLAYPEAKIGHHIHSWQHFFFSRLFGIPTVLIVRDPDASVRSLLTKKGGSKSLAYLDYIITNALGSFFADSIYFFDELTGDRGVEPLLADITHRTGVKPLPVDPERVRELMVSRTNHKNVETPKVREETPGMLTQLPRRAAIYLYGRIEKRWRA